MTTTLPTRERRHDHPPHPTSASSHPARRVSLLDRLALRLGLLLITYGRREHALTREQHAARRAQWSDVERRQREAVRRLLLMTTQR